MADNARSAAHITQLLIAWSDGRREVMEDLLSLVYGELRRLASGYIRKEPAEHRLEPTELVHEAYMRLIDQRKVHWRNRAHFYAISAQIMRRILVDHARTRAAGKRGAGWEHVPLVEDQLPSGAGDVDLVALDLALERLADIDPQQARIVELRYFGGLTIDEVAEVIRMSPATVVREWTVAKAWLRAELSR
jgi:RNA polymerase sigma factor (TIGR02999 family)